MTTQGRLQDDVWLLIGLFGNEPGQLELREGRLTFRTSAGVQFDVPLSEVSYVEYPWYYFGGGVQITVAGRRYRLSFVPPTSHGGRARVVPGGWRVGWAWCSSFRRAGFIGRR